MNSTALTGAGRGTPRPGSRRVRAKQNGLQPRNRDLTPQHRLHAGDAQHDRLEDDIHNDVFDRLLAVLFPVPRAGRLPAGRGRPPIRAGLGETWGGATDRSMTSRPPWPESQVFSQVPCTGGHCMRDAGRPAGISAGDGEVEAEATGWKYDAHDRR
jgi:hypothetical protein